MFILPVCTVDLYFNLINTQYPIYIWNLIQIVIHILN